MRPAIALAFLLAISPGLVSAQSQQRTQARQKVQQRPDPDRMGLTCAQILQMSSSEWIAKITSIDDSTVDGNLRGIRVYGKCYDERTDRLAASLAKSGKGPLMGARGNFRDFEQALQKFTAKALAESQPPADTVKSAYAGLYEKQFRYAFYQSYVQQPAKPPAPPAAPLKAVTPPPSASTTTAPPAAKDADPVTLAKNHFGEILADLPDESIHDLHAAFGEVLARNSFGASTQLAIYRYAIFLLEPLAKLHLGSPASTGDSAQPFAPPPF